MSSPSAERDLQDAIEALRHISSALARGEDVPALELVSAATPHLLRILRVALKMVELDPSASSKEMLGYAREVALARSISAALKTQGGHQPADTPQNANEQDEAYL